MRSAAAPPQVPAEGKPPSEINFADRMLSCVRHVDAVEQGNRRARVERLPAASVDSLVHEQIDKRLDDGLVEDLPAGAAEARAEGLATLEARLRAPRAAKAPLLAAPRLDALNPALTEDDVSVADDSEISRLHRAAVRHGGIERVVPGKPVVVSVVACELPLSDVYGQERPPARHATELSTARDCRAAR